MHSSSFLFIMLPRIDQANLLTSMPAKCRILHCALLYRFLAFEVEVCPKAKNGVTGVAQEGFQADMGKLLTNVRKPASAVYSALTVAYLGAGAAYLALPAETLCLCSTFPIRQRQTPSLTGRSCGAARAPRSSRCPPGPTPSRCGPRMRSLLTHGTGNELLSVTITMCPPPPSVPRCIQVCVHYCLWPSHYSWLSKLYPARSSANLGT